MGPAFGAIFREPERPRNEIFRDGRLVEGASESPDSEGKSFAGKLSQQPEERRRRRREAHSRP